MRGNRKQRRPPNPEILRPEEGSMNLGTRSSPCTPRAAVLLMLALALTARPVSAGSKVKLDGYMTGRPDDQTVVSLDDKLELTTASRITGQDAAGERALARADLVPGMLIEAEGQWLDHHKFFAERIVVDLKDSAKQVNGTPSC